MEVQIYMAVSAQAPSSFLLPHYCPVTLVVQTHRHMCMLARRKRNLIDFTHANQSPKLVTWLLSSCKGS
jgi:hypothetical protein